VWAPSDPVNPSWRTVRLPLRPTGVAVILAGYGHFTVRRLTARSVVAKLRREARAIQDRDLLDNFIRAFHKNSSIWHSIFRKRPVGWGKRAQRRLQAVLSDANRYVQDLNDEFTNPSGTGAAITRRVVEAEKIEQVSA